MSDKNPKIESRNALRRLLLVLIVTATVVLYAYSWTVTDINLARPQEEQRQRNVQSALRELLSPNIFEQDRRVIDFVAYFQVGCTDEAVPPPNSSQISISPDCGVEGDIITVSITEVEPLSEGRVRWRPPGEESSSRPRDILELNREDFVFGMDGTFVGTIEVPRVRGSESALSEIIVRAAVPDGPIRFSRTTDLVIERMIETIFMALVATTVAIPIAVIISFMGAHNLMKPIKLSVGSTLIAFVALAVGFYVGQIVLGEVISFGINIGSGGLDTIGAILARVLIFGLGVGAIFGLLRYPTIPIIRSLIIAFLIALFIGFMSGMGQLGSIQLNTVGLNIRENGGFLIRVGGAFTSLGEFLRILSELVELFAAPLGGVVGGFILSGITTGLLGAPLRRVRGWSSHLIGAGLGAASGAILMGVIGLIGTWAALLGLLSPLAAAGIGGQALVLLYTLFTQPREQKGVIIRKPYQSTIETVLFLLGAIPIFLFAFDYLNLNRAIIDGTLPPATTSDFLGLDLSAYIVRNMTLGLILGAVSGALSGVRASFPLGMVLYNVARTSMNSIRSIEPLIMGLVFVIWVGIGPFAGVLALTLHSIASLGKLYSEQVENIDPGPLEALQSTGANRLQTIIYAVIPQIIPPYVAFTMYRWDINVRMSTIIGFVGGGGIGLLLQQQINLLRYRDAGVAVLAIAIVVSILDYASASIRSRIT